MSTDAVRDEVELLERSLADARAEHAKGDLSDASFAQIEAREGARLVSARSRLDEAHRATADALPGTGRSARTADRGRFLVVAAVCVVLAAAAVLLAVTDPFAGPPKVVHLNAAGRISALLIAAEAEVAGGHQLQALTLYDAVLLLEPSSDEALIESGWLRYELGLGRHDRAWILGGAAQLAHAVLVAPTQASAHLYDGIALMQLHGCLRRATRHLSLAACRGAIDQLARSGELPETAYQQSITALFLAELHYRAP
jgi:hypothetical protein